MGDRLGPNGLSRGCKVFLLQVDEAEIVAHEADDPNAFVDFFDSQALARDLRLAGARVEPATFETREISPQPPLATVDRPPRLPAAADGGGTPADPSRGRDRKRRDLRLNNGFITGGAHIAPR